MILYFSIQKVKLNPAVQVTTQYQRSNCSFHDPWRFIELNFLRNQTSLGRYLLLIRPCTELMDENQDEGENFHCSPSTKMTSIVLKELKQTDAHADRIALYKIETTEDL